MLKSLSTFFFQRVLTTGLRWYCLLPDYVRVRVREHVAGRTGGARFEVHCPGDGESTQ